MTTAHFKEVTLGHSEYILVIIKSLNSIHLVVFVDNMLCHTEVLIHDEFNVTSISFHSLKPLIM